ncbi:uncharacterized protein LOC120349179 [Nilaparvata lugens]|uniref:uncharacterized protein LOC120349179 n=1 Tax=Nilaparvata lugens TaxID=108931 RepID=UPI00193E0A2B|nr:uncharacterized protein LOC120349179 [Nilaparvata lugens]
MKKCHRITSCQSCSVIQREESDLPHGVKHVPCHNTTPTAFSAAGACSCEASRSAPAMARFVRDEDISQLLQELEDEERENMDQPDRENIDDSDIANEFEDEILHHQLTDSESEQENEQVMDFEHPGAPESDDFSFFIGKDKETIWCSKPVSSQSRTSAKNIVKIFPCPKISARDTATELDAFLKIFDLI